MEDDLKKNENDITRKTTSNENDITRKTTSNENEDDL
jgi:hypothetical protein